MNKFRRMRIRSTGKTSKMKTESPSVSVYHKVTPREQKRGKRPWHPGKLWIGLEKSGSRRMLYVYVVYVLYNELMNYLPHNI